MAGNPNVRLRGVLTGRGTRGSQTAAQWGLNRVPYRSANPLQWRVAACLQKMENGRMSHEQHGFRPLGSAERSADARAPLCRAIFAKESEGRPPQSHLGKMWYVFEKLMRTFFSFFCSCLLALAPTTRAPWSADQAVAPLNLATVRHPRPSPVRGDPCPPPPWAPAPPRRPTARGRVGNARRGR